MDNFGEVDALARIDENLRQQRETFEQRKLHSQYWFVLKLSMGAIGALLLPAVAVVCSFIVLNPEDYGRDTVLVNSFTLLGDLISIVATVWKMVLSTGGPQTLEPVTNMPEMPARQIENENKAASKVDGEAASRKPASGKA